MGFDRIRDAIVANCTATSSATAINSAGRARGYSSQPLGHLPQFGEGLKSVRFG